MTDKKIIIGALSGWQYPERRQLVRDTYLPDLKRRGFGFHFLMGGGSIPELTSPIVEGDMLILNVPNGYQYLPQRTRAWAEWCLQFDWWDYALKIDDDTLICVDRFMEWLRGVDTDYTGLEFCIQMPYHSGGAGYLCSRRAMKMIAENLLERTGAEDQLVGALLNARGIPTSYRPEEKYREGLWIHDRYPLPENNYIVGHGKYMTREVWMDSHLRMTGAKT